MIDVQSPPWPYKPARGNGVDDDTQAIQDMILGKHRRGVLDFGHGVYKITDTLTIPHKLGFHFEGGGGFLADQMGNALHSAILDYRGPLDRPMFVCEGANGIWNGVSLRGNGCPVGIRLIRPDHGTLGTGKIAFGYLHTEGFGRAIETAGNLNADTCTWQYWFLRHCDVGLHLGHQQALTWVINYMHEITCGTLIQVGEDAAGAGRVKTNMVHMASEGLTLLEILNRGGGSAGGWFDLQGVIDDNPRPKTLVKQVDSGGGGTYIKIGPGQLKGRSSRNQKIHVDRSGDGGVTTVHLVDLLECESALRGGVTMKGKNAARQVGFYVRNCHCTSAGVLMDMDDSKHCTADGLGNWLPVKGLQPDDHIVIGT